MQLVGLNVPKICTLLACWALFRRFGAMMLRTFPELQVGHSVFAHFGVQTLGFVAGA